jgi:hypothetical protein
MKENLWPLSLGCGLLLVVLVNFAFAWIATGAAPEIDPSYEQSLSR